MTETSSSPSKPVAIAVLTISDTRTLETDRAGAVLIDGIAAAGHRLVARDLVRDDIYAIRAAVSAWIAASEPEVVLCTGGTGVTGRDGSPEAIRPLLDKVLDGFGEMFRYLSFEDIGTSSLQSRALAGVANGTFVFVLPGSPSACALAWQRLIVQQLDSRTRPCNLTDLLPRLRER